MKKSILVGIKNETAYVATIDTDREHFSITTEGYVLPPFDSDEGEEMAKNFLDDGDSWVEAVKAGNTEQGKEDWIEDTLNIDGWQEIVGDVLEIGDGKFVQLQSAGADHEIFLPEKEWDCLNITKTQLKYINASVNGSTRLHLKTQKDIARNPRLRNTLLRVLSTFESLPMWEDKDIMTMIHKYEGD